MNQTASYAAWTGSFRGDRRRRRRDRRRRQALDRERQKRIPEFTVKLTAEERRRQDERKAQIDSWVSFLSNYSWCHFLTLTFRAVQGPESIDRAIRRLMRFIHEDVYGKFDPLTDVRDLYGVRYFPAVERGRNGTKRLHAHVLITGGDLLGERVAKARWTAWREWWNREYGGLRVDQPRVQGDVAAYCTKYVLKGDDAGFELRSTWADERDWRKRAEAPLLEERKIGIDVTRSAELEKSGYRGEAPNGCGPASKGSGRICHRCGLVSLCRCSIGTPESGQVLNTPEPDAGACEGDAAKNGNGTNVSLLGPTLPAASPSPQMELRMQQQIALPLHASANKSVRFSSRREKYLQRRRAYELSRQVSSNTASKSSSGN